jgi:sugar O-acyltransferase (sialic acid O-acetyltransferase NeuD family)
MDTINMIGDVTISPIIAPRMSTVRLTVTILHYMLSAERLSSIPLVIIGAGGSGREVHDVVEAVNEAAGSPTPPYDFLGFLDDGRVDMQLLLNRGPLLGPVATMERLGSDVHYLIGIGNGTTRRKIDEWMIGLGHLSPVLVHPSSVIGNHLVLLAPGTVVCPHCSVTTNVSIGRHTHLNRMSTVGHDSVLGNYVTLNPGATVSGNVTLEDEVNLGTNASVIQGCTVGIGSIIGAGAAVIRDIPAGVTAVGVPAKYKTQ